MTDAECEFGSMRTWDYEDCPHGWCDGELQQQDRFNVMCLECESAWSHIRFPATYKEPEKHCLQGADGEVIAEKPAVATDGGAEYESAIYRDCGVDGCDGDRHGKERFCRPHAIDSRAGEAFR